MRLAWIQIRDFRNYREAEVEVPAGLVAVVGPNGQGKTNLLEAMDYLCALESPRVRADLPLVRVGASSAFLRGEVETGSGRLLINTAFPRLLIPLSAVRTAFYRFLPTVPVFFVFVILLGAWQVWNPEAILGRAPSQASG